MIIIYIFMARKGISVACLALPRYIIVHVLL